MKEKGIFEEKKNGKEREHPGCGRFAVSEEYS
jgi:hypothetical protein